jgi:hypothetical protein
LALTSSNAVYPANRDARAHLTEIQSMRYERVHRLDPINGNIPAKLLGFLGAYAGIKGKADLAGIFMFLGNG